MKLITIHSATTIGNIGAGERRVFIVEEKKKWVRLFDPHANNTAKVRKFIYNSIYIRDEHINIVYWVNKSREKYNQNSNYRKIFEAFATEDEMSVQLMHEQVDLLEKILVELKKMNGEGINTPKRVPFEDVLYGELVNGSVSDTKHVIKNIPTGFKIKRTRRTKKQMEEARAKGGK